MAISTGQAGRLVAEIASPDRAVQGRAYETLLDATASKVPWAYDIWNDLVEGLVAADNRQRSICAQVLANLAAYSDPDARILDDLDRLAAVMADERFVTARHATQAFWKVGLGGDEQRSAATTALSRRFVDAAQEKNATLIRTDIMAALARLDRACPDAGIAELASELMALEPDDAQRSRQTAAWKKARTQAP